MSLASRVPIELKEEEEETNYFNNQVIRNQGGHCKQEEVEWRKSSCTSEINMHHCPASRSQTKKEEATVYNSCTTTASNSPTPGYSEIYQNQVGIYDGLAPIREVKEDWSELDGDGDQSKASHIYGTTKILSSQSAELETKDQLAQDRLSIVTGDRRLENSSQTENSLANDTLKTSQLWKSMLDLLDLNVEGQPRVSRKNRPPANYDTELTEAEDQDESEEDDKPQKSEYKTEDVSEKEEEYETSDSGSSDQTQEKQLGPKIVDGVVQDNKARRTKNPWIEVSVTGQEPIFPNAKVSVYTKRGRPRNFTKKSRLWKCGCGQEYLTYGALYSHTRAKHGSVQPPKSTRLRDGTRKIRVGRL